MAAAFTFLAVLGAVAFIVSARLTVSAVRGSRGWSMLPAFLPLVLTTVLSGYLVAKVVYGELYPCWYVDESYCDFDSTQYHDLFGWEF